MSDPAKSPREIEDVLASIRRLVSESHVPTAAPVATVVDQAPASGDDTEEDGAGKLVLTPSLRVNDPDDPWAPVPRKPQTDATDIAEQPAAAEDGDPSWGLEDRLSDWGEIEASADESIADAMAEQMAEPFSVPSGAWQTQGFDPATIADSDSDGAEFEPETGDADWPDRSAGSALRQLALVRRQGDAAAGDSDPPFTTDLHGTPPLAAADPTQEPVSPTASGTDPTPSPETDMPMTPDHPSDPEVAEAVTGAAPVFSRRPAVHRPGAAADDGAHDAAGVEDADPSDDAADAIEDLGDAASPFTFPEMEDGILDEETLRDIIAEVVREELQGAMGQRITRNVRKMVRREIRLALAAEDLE